MPKKVLPDELDFAWLKRMLVNKMGFRAISSDEVRRDVIRFGLVPPHPRKGREEGFSFYANGLKVVVWTTWVEAEGAAREQDAGWVVIEQNDVAVYFSHDIRRTKNFLWTLIHHTRVAQLRAIHRPLCPECQQFMSIVRGRAIKARYWRCDQRENHAGRVTHRKGWDDELPQKAKEWVEEVRKLRKKNRRGKVPAVLKRHSWRKTNPVWASKR